MGESFSAKDFRTWAGTLACAEGLLQAGEPGSATEAKRTITACVKEVAGQLGNTPTVCRSSYIHPAVIEHFADGSLAERIGKGAAERRLLKFLDALDQGGDRAA